MDSSQNAKLALGSIFCSTSIILFLYALLFGFPINWIAFDLADISLASSGAGILLMKP